MLAGYTELQELGAGGYGRVVLARHDASSQLVAVKYLFDRHLADDGARARFRAEAAILRRVVSPHVARLYEFAESADGAAIVMEAVPGVSLRAIIALHGTLPPAAALTVLKGSLHGLHAAHLAGTVHRDYKPANVLVQPDRQSKLVDFGIATLSGHSGHSSGTPAYMAPEQWHGAPAAPATDVYAATCVLFHCVTGQRPYEAAELDQLRELHQHAPLPLEHVAAPLRPLLARGMAKDPAQRPRHAQEFVAELETAARKGFGKHWEREGWRRLAESAATLLAASPMAWVVGATGVLAGTGTAAGGAASGAAAGGAVGGSAGGAAAGGVAGGAAAAKTTATALVTKIAAAAIGAAVVVGATVVVLDKTSDDPPRTPPAAGQQAIDVQTAVEEQSYPDVDLTVRLGTVTVSGIADADLAATVNEALREPARDRIAELREYLKDKVDEPTPNGSATTATITPRITMRGPDFVSVRYENSFESDFMTTSSWDDMRATTVNLRSGNTVGELDMFKNALTDDGMAALAEALESHAENGICGGQQAGPERLELTSDDLGEAVQLAYTGAGIEFAVALEQLGYASFCTTQVITVPYDDIADLLDTKLVAELTDR